MVDKEDSLIAERNYAVLIDVVYQSWGLGAKNCLSLLVNL